MTSCPMCGLRYDPTYYTNPAPVCSDCLESGDYFDRSDTEDWKWARALHTLANFTWTPEHYKTFADSAVGSGLLYDTLMEMDLDSMLKLLRKVQKDREA